MRSASLFSNFARKPGDAFCPHTLLKAFRDDSTAVLTSFSEAKLVVALVSKDAGHRGGRSDGIVPSCTSQITSSDTGLTVLRYNISHEASVIAKKPHENV